MGRRKPYVDQELTFAPKISRTSKRIALRLSSVQSAEAKSKRIPRFMRETISKKLTLEPLSHVPVSPQGSAKKDHHASHTPPRIVDANDLYDPEPALATSRPLLPSLFAGADKGNGAAGKVSGGKVAPTSGAVAEDGLKTVDPFNNAMSKSAYDPPRSLQLDESVFTFRPKVSSASAKIAESLGTDFMSRQQMHLEKQKRLFEQSSQQLRFHTHLAPPVRRRDGKEADDVNNSASLQLQPVSGDSPPDVATGALTFAAGDIMGDPALGGKMCEAKTSPSSSGLHRLLTGPYAGSVCQMVFKRKKKNQRPWFAESADAAAATTTVPNRKLAPIAGTKRGDGELGDSLMRSKTMPNLGRPKLSRKLSTFNDGERLRVAKDMVEKAIKYHKVFTIQGGYSNIRHSLRRRGWVEKFNKVPPPPKKTPRTKRKKATSDDDDDDDDDNDDDDDDGADQDIDGHDVPKIAPWEEDDGVYGIMSRMLRNTNPSLFWVLKRDVIDYRFLNRDQMVNHYCKAGSFTTKVGLCVNMKNVPWFENADPHLFFPRCYRLSNDEDKLAFIDDFRLTACMNILKVAAQQTADSPPNQDDANNESPSPPGTSPSSHPDNQKASGAKIEKVSGAYSEKASGANSEKASGANSEKASGTNSEKASGAKDSESKPPCTNPDCAGAGSKEGGKCVCAPQGKAQPGSPGEGKSGAKKSGEDGGGGGEGDGKGQTEGQTKSDPRLAKPGKKRKKKRVLVPLRILETAMIQCERFLAEREHADIDRQEEPTLTDGQWDDLITWYYQLVHEDGVIVSTSPTTLNQVENVINRLKTRCPQFDMDGLLNVWIVKPGAKSRGRGIICYDRLEDMLKLVSSQVVMKDGAFVVQKYMERPLLVYNTKFDIRQWFLVTDWNPLTLWFYQDSYLRFCSQQYTLEDFDKAIHLSNNAIQKHLENGPRSSKLPEENMWTHEEFKDYLKSRKHPDAWEEVIYPGMKRAIICSLLCTQDIVEYRKSSFELYGADFMLTEDLKPWLIEINCSPSMEPSTAISSRLCKNVLDDTIKVAVDRKNDKNCDVGAFELAFKQPVVTVPPYIGISLSVEGQAVRKPHSFATRRYAEPTSIADTLFTPRPGPLKDAEEGQKKTSSGVSSAGTLGGANGTRKGNATPDDGSVSFCPLFPKTAVSESSSLAVQVGGKASSSLITKVTTNPTEGSSSYGGNKPERGGGGGEGRATSELKLTSTQTLPPSRVVYTQHGHLPDTAGGSGSGGSKRILSRTSVSTHYPVPLHHHPPSTASSSSVSRSLVVNNVESTDLKSFKPTKGNESYKLVSFPSTHKVKKTIKVMAPSGGRVTMLPENAWRRRTCNDCGAGMNLRLEISNPHCRCQQDSLMLPFPCEEAVPSLGALPNRPSPLRPRSSYALSKNSLQLSPVPLYPSGPAAGLPIQGMMPTNISPGERMLFHCTEAGFHDTPASHHHHHHPPGSVYPPSSPPFASPKARQFSPKSRRKGFSLSPRLSLALSRSAGALVGSSLGSGVRSGVGSGDLGSRPRVFYDTSKVYSPISILSRVPYSGFR